MKSAWRWGALAALAALLSFAPARVRAPQPEHDALRVGLVFDVGGRGDKGFNDSAYAGLLRAQQELGAHISYIEPVGTEDRESALRLFAAGGYDLVIGVGFEFSSDVAAVAHDFPGVRFACVDFAMDEVPPNVAALVFREEEGSFLVGAAAGLLSQSRRVGFVGGMVGPLVKRFEVGYREGVKATCPSCALDVAYAGTAPEAYRDPLKGKSLASAQISRGADVLFHASGATGHGVFEAVRALGKMAIGVDSDQFDEMPEVVVTSMLKRVDVAVFSTIQSIQHGQFRGGATRLGLAEGGVDWVKDGPHAQRIPPEVVTRVQALAAEVASGARQIPRE